MREEWLLVCPSLPSTHTPWTECCRCVGSTQTRLMHFRAGPPLPNVIIKLLVRLVLLSCLSSGHGAPQTLTVLSPSCFQALSRILLRCTTVPTSS